MTKTLVNDAIRRAAAGHAPAAMRTIGMTREELGVVLAGPADAPRAVELLAALDALPRRGEYVEHAPSCCCDACEYTRGPVEPPPFEPVTP